MSEVGPEPLEVLAGELEAAAEQLRAGELDSDQAAELVERCAELAARLGSEVERLAREARAEAPPGQETLL
jgi:hypothetical protein